MFEAFASAFPAGLMDRDWLVSFLNEKIGCCLKRKVVVFFFIIIQNFASTLWFKKNKQDQLLQIHSLCWPLKIYEHGSWRKWIQNPFYQCHGHGFCDHQESKGDICQQPERQYVLKYLLKPFKPQFIIISPAVITHTNCLYSPGIAKYH